MTMTGLVYGKPSFSTYATKYEQAPNRAWKNTVFTLPPSCSLVMTGQYRDLWSIRSGVVTGSDILIEEGRRFYRVAVGECLLSYRAWSVFRCFVYPDVPGGLCRRVGLLLVPRALSSLWQPDTDISSRTSMECLSKVWGAIPREWRREARLALPLGYVASFLDVVTFPDQPIFADDCSVP